MIRANAKEDNEATMAGFINDLNHDIPHVVGFHHYVELEDMIHIAIKVEKQLKQKGTIRQSQPLGPSKPWKPNCKQNNNEGKTKYPREMKDTSTVVKVSNITSASRNCDVKFFCYLDFWSCCFAVP